MSEAKRMKKEAMLKQVEKAKEQLEKIPTEKLRGKKPFGGFADFVREQGVMGLAIGFVLGTQTRTLVDQFVLSFINPLLGLLLPGTGELTRRTFSMSVGDQTQNFAYGAFVFQLITFIMIALVVYMVFRGLRLDKLTKKH
ncbi:hypothetical protein BH23PAT1_BH23PAT1_3840 [soil metagenome]